MGPLTLDIGLWTSDLNTSIPIARKAEIMTLTLGRGRRVSENWLRVGTIVFLVAVRFSYFLNGFTWLDHGDIEQKSAVLPVGRLAYAFVTRLGETGFYRPLVTISHSLNYAIWGMWSPGYHLTNILVHVAVSLMAGKFVAEFWGLNTLEQYLVAVIVGVHPIAWVAVGAISYVQEPLVSLFVMLTIILYAAGNTGWALVAATLALLSKETALFWIPGFLLAWHFFRDKPRPIQWPFIWGIAVVISIYVALRFISVPELWRVHPQVLSLSQHIGTRVESVSRLLFYLISPYRPPLSDSVRIVEVYEGGVIVAALSLIAGLIIAIKKGVRSDLSKMIALLAIGLFPALNLIPLPRFFSTHYGYLAATVVAVGAVYFMRSLAVAKVVVAIWIILMVLSTVNAGFLHHDDHSLFEPEIQRDPYFLEGHFYLGNYFAQTGDIQQARREYEAALAPHEGIIAFVDQPLATINLANTYAAEKNYAEADRLLEESMVSASGRPNLILTIRYDRAIIAYAQKNYAKVVELLEGQPFLTPEPVLLLAQALVALDRTAEATQLISASPLFTQAQKTAIIQSWTK
jgi:tetratricopeptide (TPR) repeat protein